MIFSALQSSVLNLDQWLTLNRSSPLEDLRERKRPMTVNQTTTFWMAKHHRQVHVRAMGHGLQQHLCAQVSPLVTFIVCGLQQHLCAQVSPLVTFTCQSNGMWAATTSVCTSKSIGHIYMSEQWYVGSNNICVHK